MIKQSFELFRHFKIEWAGLVAASLVLAALLTYHMLERNDWLLNQEKTQISHSAAAADMVISKQLESISYTLSNLRSAFIPGWENHDTTKQFMEERLKMFSSVIPNVKAVSILDRSGVVVASSAQTLIGQSFAYRDYFRTPATTTGPRYALCNLAL